MKFQRLFNPLTGNGSVLDGDDSRKWYRHGKLHRDDGPAVEWASGTKMWYHNGTLHREDGPAIEWTDGDKEWYRNGERHRDDGPAIDRADGITEWYRNGQRLPAVLAAALKRQLESEARPKTVAPVKYPRGFTL